MTHLLHLIFWGAVLFLGLSFFGISVEKVIESPAGQANLAYITYIGISFWHWLLGYAGQFQFSRAI
jgi:hypothetical protein